MREICIDQVLKIKSLLKAEGINLDDCISVIKSLNETVMPKRNIECYLEMIKEAP